MQRATLAVLALLGCASSAAPRDATVRVAASYTQSERWRPPAATSPLFEEVRAVARAAGVDLAPDEPLTETARALCRRVAADPQNRTPGARVIQSLAWLAGVTDPIPAVVVLRRAPGAMNDEARRGIAELVRSDRSTHLGVASERVDGDEVVVLALTRRRVQLDPVGRSFARGARIALRGRVLDDARAPVLVVTRPDGRTAETPLGDVREFATELQLDARGAWQVELTADSDAGNTVLANFPVYVDAPVPATPDDVTPEVTDAPEAVAARLLELINESRRAAGLAPVQEHPTLAAVARGHASDMAVHRFVAHTSPTTGGPADRLRAAGFVPGLATENVARGYAAQEIHDGLMASPGHRANILHPEVTHVGVSVARETGSQRALLVAQVFAEVPRPVDASRAAATLLDGVNRARASRGLAPLTAHPALTVAAQEAARMYFARPELDQQAVFQEAARGLQRQGAAFRRVSVAGAFGTRLDGAERMDALLAPELGAIGVAVAQGDRPGQPAGAVLAVFVTAVPR